jgi:uncharacterized protein YprB with RNaseH-like and TPR domain
MIKCSLRGDWDTSNLRDRLKRIQELNKNKPYHTEAQRREDTEEKFQKAGWEECGFQVLKRVVEIDLSLKIGKKLPKDLGVIIPDLAWKDLPGLEDFLFFDLETSGLSGGAGTLAFLAAFGKFRKKGKKDYLEITQYLLLDYPGENDFIIAVLKEFKENKVIVSYNGKCFDAQILKTRCIMNGIKPPVFLHADLLHPARRLWKNLIQDCSQCSVERNILKIERIDDIPGSLAPDIWFEFLRTGVVERLFKICDHNTSDILGLSSILAAMINIAQDSVNTKYKYDKERIAYFRRKHNAYYEKLLRLNRLTL